MSAYEHPVLLPFMKTHLRIGADTTILDDEVNGLIAAALADMQMRGIDTQAAFPAAATTVGDMKPLAVRAAVYYCKANFGTLPDAAEADAYNQRYEGLTQAMSHSDEYRAAPESAQA